jgi:hypothetical protein
MKTLQATIRFGAVIGAWIACSASAQLKLEHDSSWELTGRQCTIRVLQLANLGGEDTAPLFLSIYAQRGTAYAGTGSPGQLVARAPIGALAANTISNNIVVTTRGRLVPPGEKFTMLAVETQDGRRFTILDYVVYTSTYTFPRRQNGGVGSEDAGIGAGGDVVLRGAVSLTGQRRTADFAIDEIQNQRENAVTGLLRLAVYATPEPYNGTGTPVVVAVRPLGHLAQGDFYNHLQGRLVLRRPGRGTFYLTLVVEEDQGGGFQPVAYYGAPEPRQF